MAACCYNNATNLVSIQPESFLYGKEFKENNNGGCCQCGCSKNKIQPCAVPITVSVFNFTRQNYILNNIPLPVPSVIVPSGACPILPPECLPDTCVC